MKRHRFFIPELGAEEILLTEPGIVHQLSRVLRIHPGEHISLCDGRGTDAHAEVTAIDGHSVQVRIIDTSPAWVPPSSLAVYLSVIRKERFEWALEKCTEIGASSFTPLLTERAERSAPRRDRAEKIVKEAAEQCGRGDIPVIHNPVQLDDLPLDATFLMCDQQGLLIERGVTLLAHGTHSILIGPEGGWTVAERAFMETRTVRAVSLGPTTLRAETAAVVASARLMAVLLQNTV